MDNRRRHHKQKVIKLYTVPKASNVILHDEVETKNKSQSTDWRIHQIKCANSYDVSKIKDYRCPYSYADHKKNVIEYIVDPINKHRYCSYCFLINEKRRNARIERDHHHRYIKNVGKFNLALTSNNTKCITTFVNEHFLTNAVRYGDIEIVQKLLDFDCVVSQAAITKACQYGYTTIAKLLCNGSYSNISKEAAEFIDKTYNLALRKYIINMH